VDTGGVSKQSGGCVWLGRREQNPNYCRVFRGGKMNGKGSQSCGAKTASSPIKNVRRIFPGSNELLPTKGGRAKGVRLR